MEANGCRHPDLSLREPGGWAVGDPCKFPAPVGAEFERIAGSGGGLFTLRDERRGVGDASDDGREWR